MPHSRSILAASCRKLEIGLRLTYPWTLTKPFNYFIATQHTRNALMKNPLDSIVGTIISGFVLTLILYVFARNFLGLTG